MRKFLKYTVIFGCLLFLLGTGVATVAFALGGNPFHAMEQIEERFDHYSESLEGRMDSEPYTTSYENVTFEAEYHAVTDLEIDVEGGYVTILTDPELTALIVFSETGKQEHLIHKNMEHFQKLEVLAKRDETYTIVVPESWELRRIDVECNGGIFDCTQVFAKNGEFSVVGGEVDVYQLGGQSISLESSGGTMRWTGSISGLQTLDAECAGGEIDITLYDVADSDAIGYELECVGGTIDFFETSYKNIVERKQKVGAGMPFMDLEAVGGSIRVHP